MKTFLLAGGTGNEDFRFPLRSVKQKLEQALLDIGFKDKDAANKHMSDNKLTYKDICTHAEDTYRTLFDRKEWPPARHAHDSKAPPASFNLADAMPMTRSEVMLLMQSKSPGAGGNNKGASSAKTGNCHKCGKPGHWSRECPNGDATNDNGGSGGRPARNGNGGRMSGDRAGRAPTSHGNRSAPSASNPTSWKTVAPQPGTPITKQHNNRTFNWCLKCKRWTTTHVTATHTGGKAANTNAVPDNRPSVNFSLIQDPSVWSTAVAAHPSMSDIWFGIQTAIGAFFPVYWLILWVLACAIAPNLVDFIQVVGSVVKASAVTVASTFVIFQAIDWNSLALQVSEVVIQVVGCVLAHHQELLAPLLWLILLMAPFWAKAPPASNKDPPPHLHRNQRRAIKKAQAHQRNQVHANRTLSIRSEGIHRSYPLRLRSQGHFVGHQAPTVNHQNRCRQLAELRHQVMKLTTQVARLQHCGGSPRQNVRNQHELSIMAPAKSPFIRRRARSCPKSKYTYQPVVASGLRANGATHGLGNQKWTDRQMNAACKIAFHVKMETVPMHLNPTTLRMAMQAPGRFRDSLPSSTFSVIWDSGASISISPDKNDFVGPLESPGAITQLKGIAKGLRIEGFGHVMWTINDSNGNLRMVKVPAYYAPKVRVRLLSTTSLLQTYPEESIKIEAHQLVLSGIPGDLTRGELVALINPENNLPTSEAHSFKDTPIAVEALNVAISTVNDSNINLSEPEKELLRWHYRLGHMNFRKIQFLMRTGILSKSEANRRLHIASCKVVTPPKCAACQYGKQHQRPVPGKTTSVVKDRAGALKNGDLLPGQQISMDHFICKSKGRLFTSAGKSLLQDMFCGGCLFIDHASSFVHVEFQVHLNTAESLNAKDKFERMCRDVGVVPQAYLSDNGAAFTSAEYSRKMSTSKQVIQFAGVGAHHQNGNAERAIQTIMSVARTMMLHAAIHWPDVADTALWPMAVTHAVFLHNHVPNPTTGLAAGDVFTKSRWEQRKFHDVHVWGCPVYVLDSKVSGGMKLPRWSPRSVRCINVGFSTNHASTVPLVLNPTTGYITAQFHIVFDDWFATIATDVDAFPDFMSDRWYRMFGDSHYQYPFDEDDLSTERDQLCDDRGTIEHERGDTIRSTVATAMDVHAPTVPLPVTPLSVSQFYPEPTPGHLLTPSMSSRREELSYQAPNSRLYQPIINLDPPYGTPYAPMSPPREPEEEEAMKTPMSPVPVQELPRQRYPTSSTREQVPSPHKSPSANQPESIQVPPSASLPTPPASVPSPVPVNRPSLVSPIRRSTRQRNAPSRLGFESDQGRGYIAEPSAWIFAENGLLPPPYAYKAAISDPDTLTYDQAMADTANASAWRSAAAKEIVSLERNATWIEVTTDTAKTKILPGTWVFRRKRTPDGEISKYKARYCVRGDMEEGDPETYAPVVAWSSVRLFLILAITLSWETCSIDFSSAFVQAKLEEPVWIHLPRGFRSEKQSSICLQLVKSLYGLSVAPRLWYEHVVAALLQLGFKQSATDQCFLYRPTIIIVLYVDDLGIAYSNSEDVEEFFANLANMGFEFTREGSFTDFLGIKFERDEANNTVTLTQKGLIQKIIAATGMEDCNPNWTPATQQALGIDPDGEPMNETWSYPSIVGMLLYLSTNTRIDISFAVSQVARFNHSPKKSHATAVKTIVRYLHRTSDKGTIITPSGDLSLDCYVDADFAGLFGRDPDREPSSVKSRTGYLITLGNAPIIWKSQLQTEISLSTLESEYSALSTSMRALLPLLALLKEVIKALLLPYNYRASIRARVFEDNNGALLLATNQRLTNRTKYFLVKWHFFWSYVKSGVVQVLKIDTKEQRADYLTKGLSREIFERIRKLTQGW